MALRWRPYIFIFALCLCFALQAHIETAADLMAALETNRVNNLPFFLNGLVTCRLECRHYAVYTIEDGTGSAVLTHYPRADDAQFVPGDRLSVQGVICFDPANPHESIAPYNDARDRKIRILSHETAPTPVPFDVSSFKSGLLDNKPCRLTGIVRDFRRDELDPEWNYMVLETDGAAISLYASADNERQEELMALIGSTITATGLCIQRTQCFRRKLGRVFHLQRFSEMRIVRAASPNPFDVPDLSRFEHLQPSDIQSLGRCRLFGTVLAVWHGDSVLIQTSESDYARLELMSDDTPHYGARIEAVGYPETDLSQIILTRAQWRPASVPTNSCGMLNCPIADNQPFIRNGGCVNAALHGKCVRFRGTVAERPAFASSGTRFLVKNETGSVLVDASDIPDAADILEIGSLVELTGTFVVTSENWRRNSALPRITGFFIALRHPSDIKVLAQPPWWTPAKLFWALGILMAIIVIILIWNTILRALVIRKSRELLKEQAEKLSEMLKVDERTRLAAELHDFHSQSLTAVAYQVSAARNSCKSDPDETEHLLTTASRMLKSCRTDLRRCLWDLRNDTLNEPDFKDAIRQTVLPVAGAAKVSVRFVGRRTQISDSTAHAVLSILRELTANAVNHGHADRIRIAGEYRRQILRISIADNGHGFDPQHRPGQNEGHFGLDGIQERISRLRGQFEIDSRPDKGTYARITIKHSQPDVTS